MAFNNLILDASAFYSGVLFQSGSKCYTTYEILEEIKHIHRHFSLITMAIQSGNLVIHEPSREIKKKVMHMAKKTGDYSRLSTADISILTLALELNFPLVTNDYAVQNVGKLLEISIKSAGIAGISNIRKWITVCKTCRKNYGSQIKICDICGNKLTRMHISLKIKKDSG
ncbi:MAG: nucleotide-binding protein [Nitrososphaeraceae archaeon]|nr:nucleotide-binding protein [Nitrososphaeraceae archaeon]